MSTFYKRLFVWAFLFVVSTLVWSCDSTLDSESPSGRSITYSFAFSKSSENWFQGFADYPTGRTQDNYYELSFTYAQVPLFPSQKDFGLYLSGFNRNADLFMYIKHRFDNLKAGAGYEVDFEVDVISVTPGYDPETGGGVYVKAGATAAEPLENIVENTYIMNLDKGAHGTGGADAVVLGNIAVAGEDENAYTQNIFDNDTPFLVTASDTGTLWVMLGIDSEFMGKTSVYISNVKITFTEHL
ncbi:hypothetical protein ACFL47_07290 [Candidatus Latescibacterota bacterium]